MVQTKKENQKAKDRALGKLIYQIRERTGTLTNKTCRRRRDRRGRRGEERENKTGVPSSKGKSSREGRPVEYLICLLEKSLLDQSVE